MKVECTSKSESLLKDGIYFFLKTKWLVFAPEN